MVATNKEICGFCNFRDVKIKQKMYPCPNKIKQTIRNGELVKYEYVEKYKNISPCLILYFNTEPFIKPIREYRFAEYEAILNGA